MVSLIPTETPQLAKSHPDSRGTLSIVRNVLMTLGVFWLSFWVAWALAWPFSGLNNGIKYGDGIFSAIALGVMSSMGRTLAAILAGVLLTVVVTDRNAELWGLFLAALYVLGARTRYHSGYPATEWDRLWQGVSLIFPAVACIVAVVLTARLRKKRIDRRGAGLLRPSA
jgi:hypothetical protein